MLGKLGVQRVCVLGQCPFHFPSPSPFPFLLSFFFSLHIFLSLFFHIFLSLFPILKCPLTTESYPSHAPGPTAAICPTSDFRVLLPENSNSKLFRWRGAERWLFIYELSECDKIVQRKKCKTFLKFQFHSPIVAGQEDYCSPTNCPSACYFKNPHSIFDIRHSISVEALPFLGVPRGLLPTFVFLQWRA